MIFIQGPTGTFFQIYYHDLGLFLFHSKPVTISNGYLNGDTFLLYSSTEFE